MNSSNHLVQRAGLWLVVLVGLFAATARLPALMLDPPGAQQAAGAQQPASPPAAASDAKQPGLVADPVTLAEARLADAEPAGNGPTPADSKTAPSEAIPPINPLELMREGGFELIAIIIVSIIALAFAVERFLGLRRRKVLPTPLVAGLTGIIEQQGGFDPRLAAKLCRQYPSAAATVVETTLQKIGRPNAELEHAVEEVSQREASRLYANVRWQSLAFNVAPMLGLLGTIRGMIIAFYETSHLPANVSRAENLASGIYAALVNTFAGLAVAIPAAILAHVLETRILKLMGELDDLMRRMLPQMERFEGRAQSGYDQPGGAAEQLDGAPAEDVAAGQIVRRPQ